MIKKRSIWKICKILEVCQKTHLVNFKANVRKIKSLDPLFKILHFIFKLQDTLKQILTQQ